MFVELTFLIPILVFLKFFDSYLTVWAYNNYLRFGRRFMVLESYEANPRWQKDVAHGFKDWRHFSFLLFLIILLSALYFYPKDKFWYDFAAGFAMFMYLSINFEHLTHMREMELMPKRVKGKIFISLDYYFSAATHNYVKFSAILSFAWIATQSDFLLGGIFGPLLIASFIKTRWRAYSSEEK
ncbi:MAG: hypothetical protein AABX01_07000 [Candidatus Micrarchaeota archaeon]